MNSAGTLLLVEDDSNDLFFIERGLSDAKSQLSLQVVTDGNKAIDYLAGNGKYSDRAKYPLPYLVLMGFRMPCRTGLEVLKWMKRNNQTCKIPVILASGRPSPMDVEEAYALGAVAVISKPVDCKALVQIYEGGILASHSTRSAGTK